VRDFYRPGVEETYARVLKCAKGAAIATETKYKVNLLTGVHAYLLNRPMTELLARNLDAAGAPQWTEAEQRFAKTIQKATGKPEEGLFVGIKPMPEKEQDAKGGSTDVAEISRIVPTAKFRIASAPVKAPWHAWPVVACGGMSIGHKALIQASKTLAGATVELLASPEVISSAKQEFDRKMAGKVYKSPLPPGAKPLRK